MDSKGI